MGPTCAPSRRPMLRASALLAALTLATLPAPARAQGAAAPPAAAAAAPEPSEKAVLPYIDEGTFLVARLDLERVDPDALAQYMHQTTERQIKSGEGPESLRDGVAGQAAAAKAWLAGMRDAGAKHVYVLMDLRDMQDRGNDDPVVVIPVPAGADADRIMAQFNPNPRSREMVERVGEAVIFAEKPQMERVRQLVASGAPSDRPDLPAAFAAAGDAPLRLAFVPGESARAFVDERLPKLPDYFGGGEGTLLSRDLKWVTIAITQKPATTANLTFHAAGDKEAKPVFDAIGKGLASAKEAVAADPRGAETGKQLASIEPKLAGQDVTLSIDPMLVMKGIRVIANPARQAPPAPAPPGGQPAKPDDGGL